MFEIKEFAVSNGIVVLAIVARWVMWRTNPDVTYRSDADGRMHFWTYQCWSDLRKATLEQVVFTDLLRH